MTEHANPPADPAPETPAEAPAGASDTGASSAPSAPEAPAPKPKSAPTPTPEARPTLPAGTWWWGTGRRKASVARVRIRPGTGKFVVNKRPYDEVFTGDRDRNDLLAVLEETRTTGAVDIHVNVHGGGTTGQAGAIILGLARALRAYDGSLEPILRDKNFLTRDPRRVERKKYGQPGARARFQFSKR